MESRQIQVQTSVEFIQTGSLKVVEITATYVQEEARIVFIVSNDMDLDGTPFTQGDGGYYGPDDIELSVKPNDDSQYGYLLVEGDTAFSYAINSNGDLILTT